MSRRPCDSCGGLYEAKTVRSRFCSSSCRSRAARARQKATQTASDQGVSVPSRVAFDGPGLLSLTRRRLTAAGRVEHELGALTLLLAERMVYEQSGQALATLSKEYRAVLAEATDGATATVDPLDELRARRMGRHATG